MSINLNEKRNPKITEFEKILEKVFNNKTSGAAIALEAWSYLRIRTLDELKGMFTKEEILGITDLYNGTIFEVNFSSHSQYLLFAIEDGEKFQNQSIRFGYDFEKLRKKVEKLTAAQTYFLLEEIQRFWNKESLRSANVDEDVLGEFVEKFI